MGTNEIVVCDIDGTVLTTKGLYGEEVKYEPVFHKLLEHIQKGRKIVFLTNRNFTSYSVETMQTLKSFGLKENDFSLVCNIENKDEITHKIEHIKDFIKIYKIVEWFEDNKSLEVIANKYQIPFTLIEQNI